MHFSIMVFNVARDFSDHDRGQEQVQGPKRLVQLWSKRSLLQQNSIQVLAARLSAGESALDASDTGTGKTPVALWAAKAVNLPKKGSFLITFASSWKGKRLFFP
jgi:hypothetical protein